MREIKFRGYDIDNKKWRYGGYVKFHKVQLCIATEEESKENEEHLIIFEGFSDWNLSQPRHMADVVAESVGQYTNLKDKNGKEIYEGDIVHETKYNRNYKIGFVVNGNKSYFSPLTPTGKICYANMKNIEILGNIYENPSLLEGVE